MDFSRAVGYRFGPHLAEAVPILISYCENASENDDELRENSLQVSVQFLDMICEAVAVKLLDTLICKKLYPYAEM